MHTTITYVTHDGVIHRTERDAAKHLDAMYADILCKMAHQLVRLEKYTAACEWIDANLSSFARLAEIKADSIVHCDIEGV